MRNKLNRLPIPVTIIIAVLLVGLFFLALDGSGIVFELLGLMDGWFEYASQAVCETVALLVFLGVTLLFGYKFIFKNKGIGFFKGFYVAGFMLTYCIMDILAQVYIGAIMGGKLVVNFGEILIYVIAVCLVGLVEELVFRGVILNLLYDRFKKTRGGILAAIIVDGLLFGSMHFMNMLAGVEFLPALVQVLSATCLGMIFATIYVRTGNFWILVILHTWVDMASLLSNVLFGDGSITGQINNYSPLSFIAVGLFLIPTVVLLRKSKLDEIVARANGQPVIEGEEQGRKLGIVSMILGIISLAVSWTGVLAGIGVVGILGAIYSKKLKKYNNGFAIAGLICSIIGVCISLLMVVVLAAFYASNSDMLSSYYNF